MNKSSASESQQTVPHVSGYGVTLVRQEAAETLLAKKCKKLAWGISWGAVCLSVGFSILTVGVQTYLLKQANAAYKADPKSNHHSELVSAAHMWSQYLIVALSLAFVLSLVEIICHIRGTGKGQNWPVGALVLNVLHIFFCGSAIVNQVFRLL